MENDELKNLIKQSIREVLQESLSWPEDHPRYKDHLPSYFFYRYENYLRGEKNELGTQVERLSLLVSKFESWASSKCKYDANEISAVKGLLVSIDNKLPP